MTKLFQTILFLLCFVFISIAHTEPEQGGYSSALDKINHFHAELLNLMKIEKEDGFSVRHQKIIPVIDKTFDVPAIARVIFSRYWNDLTEIKQTEIVELLRQLTSAHYAAQFSDFDNEKFRIIDTEISRRGRIIVKTNLVTADKEIIKLDYLMHERNQEWKVISVIANGVNDLALKRSEYADVIKKEGLETLLGQIREKINNLRNP